MNETIRFLDLQTQRKRLEPGLSEAIQRVLEHGQFIMGPEVDALEEQLADFCGSRHCISCANGTDALAIVLKAIGVGRGDAVFVPAFTFVATAEAVAWVGATPVFVDVNEQTFILDADALEQAIETARQEGLTPRVVIPVDLFGLPADYAALQTVAAGHSLYILADAAQSLGARYRNRQVGVLASATATSFFPSKPLGCYGDGGAVFTDDGQLAEAARSIRAHGKGGEKYDNVRIGLNSRLDTLQAAILLQKLTIFDSEIDNRISVAARYNALLDGVVETPSVADDTRSVWAQYTIRSDRRDDIIQACRDRGVPTAIYYPKSLPQQSGYNKFPVSSQGTPVADRLALTVLSLPMHPYLRDEQIELVASAVREGLQ